MENKLPALLKKTCSDLTYWGSNRHLSVIPSAIQVIESCMVICLKWTKCKGVDAHHRWTKVWFSSESNWHLLKGYSSSLSPPAKNRSSYNCMIYNAFLLRLHQMLSAVKTSKWKIQPMFLLTLISNCKKVCKYQNIFHNYNDSRV